MLRRLESRGNWIAFGINAGSDIGRSPFFLRSEVGLRMSPRDVERRTSNVQPAFSIDLRHIRATVNPRPSPSCRSADGAPLLHRRRTLTLNRSPVDFLLRRLLRRLFRQREAGSERLSCLKPQGFLGQGLLGQGLLEQCLLEQCLVNSSIGIIESELRASISGVDS
jgi:hypothetical protein